MRILLVVAFLIFLSHLAEAETIELSNGSVIRAPIVSRSPNEITVNLNGVMMTYLLSEVISIDGDLDARIEGFLKERGYPKLVWPAICDELKSFLLSNDYARLKISAQQASNSPKELIEFIKRLNGLIRARGYLDFRHPHPLISDLVNGFGGERIASFDDSGSFACSATAQLISILFDLLGIDGRIAVGPQHVFNIITLSHNQAIFADFSNQIFEIVDLDRFYREEGRYLVLKERHRLALKEVEAINQGWAEGLMPKSQIETLNLGIYFYLTILDKRSVTAILYSNRGNDDKFNGQLTKALEDYAKALSINPDIAGIYCNRGLVLVAQGKLSEAIADYDRAIELNPNDASAYNDRGLAYKQKGNIVQAIKDLKKALELKADSVEIYNNFQNANLAKVGL